MTNPTLPPTLTHYRVDDLPLLLGLLQQMQVPQVFDATIGDHAAHQGLSSGWLITIWLAFIITQSDHTKSHVEDWVRRHLTVLQRLTKQPVTVTDFNDTRLGNLLRRLSQPEHWESFEAALWAAHGSVYQLLTPALGELPSQMIDTTTASGYHTPQAEGVMQHGHSKDHRPDLPQLKLVTVSLHPHGMLATTAVRSGEQADDPLYLEMIVRARAITGRTGMLHVGDSKMSAMLTRGGIVAGEDFYLTAAALVGEIATRLPEWINTALATPSPRSAIINAAGEQLGEGYEISRNCEVLGPLGPRGGERRVNGEERVLVFRSDAVQARQQEALEVRLQRATQKLETLNQPAGRGRKRLTTPTEFEGAVEAILDAHQVRGLLRVTPKIEEQRTEPLVGPGRRGGQRAIPIVVTQRFTVDKIEREETAIAHAVARLGWRVLLTNAPASLSLSACVTHYRANVVGERNYHLLKAEPLGISPLFVHNTDQIIGLTHLLTLGMRVLLLLEIQTRRGLAAEGVAMAGLYPGNPKQATTTPTAVAMLRAISRMELTLTVWSWQGESSTQLTALPPLLTQILRYVNLPPTLYTDLAAPIAPNSA